MADMKVPGLLDTIVELSPGRPLAVLMRHAEREPITDLNSALWARLTPRGRARARAFGSGLPPGRSPRIFHSPVERCEHTAREIEAGLGEAGGRALEVTASDILGGPYVLDAEALLKVLALKDPKVFFDEWRRGGIDSTIISPLKDAAVQTLRFMLERLAGQEGRGLDVHVSHDINILILLSLVVDLIDPRAFWPGYMEGIALLDRGRQLEIAFRGKAYRLDRGAV
jgi:broad specificity phosphatase PhoE